MMANTPISQEKTLQYKTLYITNLFPLPGTNSAAFAIQRIKALQKSGIDVVVVCLVNKTPPRAMSSNIKNVLAWFAKQSTIPDRCEVDGIPVYYIKRFQVPQPIFGWYTHLLLYWQILGELRRIISQAKPDIILSAWLPSGVVACKLGKYFGIPTLVLAEGSDVNFLPNQLPHWHVAQSILNEGAAAQIFVSNALKEQAVQAGLNGKRMIVIHNGVDDEIFSIRKKSTTTHVMNILAVGNLETVKGFQFLIDAFFIISKKYSQPIYLTIVGNGSLKSDLQKQVHELNLGGQVKLVPSMPQRDLVGYYQQANLLCVSSLQEGFPCVIVEAMACGTPVVASCVGGIAEIVDSTSGILVPPGNSDVLAQALMDALERKWDSNSIRERVIQNFTWGLIGKEFLNLIRGVSDS